VPGYCSVRIRYRIVPHSHTTCHFSTAQKPTLDKDQLSNCLPVSGLCLVSKITERVEHETAVLYIHKSPLECNRITKIVTSLPSPPFCSCLSVFHTVHRNILINRLSSWFGICGSTGLSPICRLAASVLYMKISM